MLTSKQLSNALALQEPVKTRSVMGARSKLSLPIVREDETSVGSLFIDDHGRFIVEFEEAHLPTIRECFEIFGDIEFQPLFMEGRHNGDFCVSKLQIVRWKYNNKTRTRPHLADCKCSLCVDKTAPNYLSGVDKP